MEENVKENIIEIKYIKPATWRKFMARVIDAIIFALLFGALFIPTRAIVSSTSSYKEANELITKEQLDSGLFKKKDDGTIIDIITYYNQDTYTSVGNKIKALDGEIAYFTDEYCVSKVEPVIVETLKADMKEFFLNDKFTFDGQKYFIVQDGRVIRNPSCTADSQKYYDNVYSDYFDLHLQAFFTKNIPNVYEQYKTINNLVIFVEIPIPVLISSFLTYIVPTFIFKRNRSTIGRLSYKIGLIDDRCLAVKTKKIVIKNLILYFGEIVLSVFTFGIPMLISFTMSIATKNKQTFSEYMTGVVEIDCGHTSVYFSKEEIKVEMIDTHNKPVNFKS